MDERNRPGNLPSGIPDAGRMCATVVNNVGKINDYIDNTGISGFNVMNHTWNLYLRVSI